MSTTPDERTSNFSLRPLRLCDLYVESGFVAQIPSHIFCSRLVDTGAGVRSSWAKS